jgi:antitoxin (DNA-binding transcriptional repressor) of toxin-antitoxin stability system
MPQYATMPCAITDDPQESSSVFHGIVFDLTCYKVYYLIMLRINIYEARTHFSEYLKRLGAGETIILCKRNTPVAEMRGLPVRPGKRRPFGLAAGKVRVTKSFFEPLPEDVIASFRGGSE